MFTEYVPRRSPPNISSESLCVSVSTFAPDWIVPNAPSAAAAPVVESRTATTIAREIAAVHSPVTRLELQPGASHTTQATSASTPNRLCNSHDWWSMWSPVPAPNFPTIYDSARYDTPDI